MQFMLICCRFFSKCVVVERVLAPVSPREEFDYDILHFHLFQGLQKLRLFELVLQRNTQKCSTTQTWLFLFRGGVLVENFVKKFVFVLSLSFLRPAVPFVGFETSGRLDNGRKKRKHSFFHTTGVTLLSFYNQFCLVWHPSSTWTMELSAFNHQANFFWNYSTWK